MTLCSEHGLQFAIQPFKAIPVIEDGRDNTKCIFWNHLSVKKAQNKQNSWIHIIEMPMVSGRNIAGGGLEKDCRLST